MPQTYKDGTEARVGDLVKGTTMDGTLVVGELVAVHAQGGRTNGQVAHALTGEMRELFKRLGGSSMPAVFFVPRGSKWETPIRAAVAAVSEVDVGALELVHRLDDVTADAATAPQGDA